MNSMSHRSLNTATSDLTGFTVSTPPTLEESLEFFDMFYDMVEIARVR
jgi:hypothetical protein